MNRELEAEVYCPQCQHLYGQIYRVCVGPDLYIHQCLPDSIRKFCNICEVPLERKHA